MDGRFCRPASAGVRCSPPVIMSASAWAARGLPSSREVMHGIGPGGTLLVAPVAIAGEGMAGIFRDGPGFEATSCARPLGRDQRRAERALQLARHPHGTPGQRSAAARRRRRDPRPAVTRLVLFAEALAAGLAPVARELELSPPIRRRSCCCGPTARRPDRARPGSSWSACGTRSGCGPRPTSSPPPSRNRPRCGPAAAAPACSAPALSLYLARAGADAISTCWTGGMGRWPTSRRWRRRRPPAARCRPGGPDPRPDLARRDGRDGRLLDRVRRGTPALRGDRLSDRGHRHVLGPALTGFRWITLPENWARPQG